MRQLIASAGLDIARHAWLAPHRWLCLCEALELLGLRASALEGILEGACPVAAAPTSAQASADGALFGGP